MFTLGIDASTTTAGYAIVDKNNSIRELGWIDLTKKELIREKVNLIIDFIKNHKDFSEITKINLESAVSGFGFGGTSQQTIIKLARFNAVLEYVIEETFKDKPLGMIGATTARKKVFGKARLKGVKAKVYVKMQLDCRFDLTPFIKKNKIGNVDKRNEDSYDALVLALNH